MVSGDGWVQCAAGHRHWGRFGAAGLLLHDAGRVILQHRAPWTHEGDRWGVPGGARHSDEDPVGAAIREAAEEAGLAHADVDPIGLYIEDHGGWSYSTVVARATRPVQPAATDAESVAVRWHPVEQVTRLPLHSGFAAAWQRLQRPPKPLYLLLAAELATDPLLAVLLRDGIAADRLPTGITAAGLHRLYPHPVIASPGGESATAPNAEPIAAAEQWATAAGRIDHGQLLVARDHAELAILADPPD